MQQNVNEHEVEEREPNNDWTGKTVVQLECNLTKHGFDIQTKILEHSEFKEYDTIATVVGMSHALAALLSYAERNGLFEPMVKVLPFDWSQFIHHAMANSYSITEAMDALGISSCSCLDEGADVREDNVVDWVRFTRSDAIQGDNIGREDGDSTVESSEDTGSVVQGE